MKCLYEVLEVDLNSDESTIRTAYRKLALRCHPGTLVRIQEIFQYNFDADLAFLGYIFPLNKRLTCRRRCRFS
jgi:hypothetical protein